MGILLTDEIPRALQAKNSTPASLITSKMQQFQHLKFYKNSESLIVLILAKSICACVPLCVGLLP